MRSKIPFPPVRENTALPFAPSAGFAEQTNCSRSDSAGLVLVGMKTKMFGVDKALRQLKFCVKNTRAAVFGQPAVSAASISIFCMSLACINIYTGALETGFEMKVPF